MLTCNGCSRRVQFDPDIDFPCTGARPWLPHAGAEACTGRERPIERTSTAAYYAWQMSSLTIPVAGADNPALLHALTDNATLRTLRRLTRTPEIVSNITAVATRLGIRTDDEEVTGPASLLLTRNRVSAVVCVPATWLRSLPSRPPGSVPVLDELTITDRHLQAATGVERFVMPWAAGDNPSRETDWLVPAARFPLIEACSNPECQRLVRRDPADANEGRRGEPCREKHPFGRCGNGSLPPLR